MARSTFDAYLLSSLHSNYAWREKDAVRRHVGRSGFSRRGNVSPTEVENDVKREIEVEIPAQEVAKETDTLIQKYQKAARLPGFRRGHVPASIIRQRFSEEIKSDVVEALVPRYFRQE